MRSRCLDYDLRPILNFWKSKKQRVFIYSRNIDRRVYSIMISTKLLAFEYKKCTMFRTSLLRVKRKTLFWGKFYDNQLFHVLTLNNVNSPRRVFEDTAMFVASHCINDHYKGLVFCY